MKLIFVNDKNYTRKNSCLALYNIFNYGKSEKLYLLTFYLAPPKYKLAPRMPPPPNCKSWRRHCLSYLQIRHRKLACVQPALVLINFSCSLNYSQSLLSVFYGGKIGFPFIALHINNICSQYFTISCVFAKYV